MAQEPGIQTSLTFDEIINQVPEGEPNRFNFDEIVGRIPVGQPAGFQQQAPAKEYGKIQEWWQGMTDPSPEEVMGQAQGIIALSELTGKSPTEIALDNNTLKDVYEEPTIGEAVKMRVDQVNNRFTTAKEMHLAAVEWSNAFQDQDEDALLEATLRYEAAQIAQRDDPRLGKYQGWIIRSTSDLTGQIYGQLNDAKGYFVGGAALGAATTGTPAGSIAGGTVAGGYGMLKSMYDSALGSYSMSKIQEGMDPRDAYFSSIPAAGVIAISERLKLNALVRNIPGLKALTASSLSKAAKQVEHWTLTRAGKEAIRSGLEGSGQEAFQTLIEQIDMEVSKELSNQLRGTDLEHTTIEQVITEIKDTFKEVLPGMLILGGAGSSAGYSADLINRKTDARLNGQALIEQVAPQIGPLTAQGEFTPTLRDGQGAEVELGETLPVDETTPVMNEDGDIQPTMPLTDVEVAEQELRTKEPLMTDEEFDNLVMTPDEDLDAALDEAIEKVQQTGDRYGDFVANIREALGKKQAKVIEGLIEARARATNRTPEQFAEDHQLRFGVTRDENGVFNASVEFIQDGETIIRAFQNATLKDVAHEVSHVFRKDLSQAELSAAEQAFGVKDGKWDRAAEERFADGFIQYMADGTVANENLQSIFEKFRLWLGKLYESFQGTDINVTPEMRAIFDAMLAENVNQDYQHRMAQARQATHTLFSEAGVTEETEKRKRKTAKQVQEERLQTIIDEQAALKQALKEKVITARQAASKGQRIGYMKAKAEAFGIAQRASTRAKTGKVRSKWRKRITKLVKSAKTKKQSGKRKGKFTADFQDIADTFIEIMSMPVKEAKQLDREMDYEQKPENFTDDFTALRRWLIRTRANSNRMDAESLKQLHADLKGLFEDQVNVRHSEMAPRIAKIQQTKAALLQSLAVLRDRQGLDPSVRNAYENHVNGLKRWFKSMGHEVLYDFHGLMERLDMGMDLAFGEGFMVRFTETLDAENASNTGRRVMNTRMLMEAAEIYGLKDENGNPDIKMAERKLWEEERQTPRLIAKWEVLDKNGDGTGRFHEEYGTTPTIRNLWMKLQDPEVLKQYKANGMTDSDMASIRGELSNEDINFIAAQFKIYNEYYSRVNEVYRKAEGASLPANEFYSPIIRDVNEGSEHGVISDLLTDISRTTQHIAPGSVALIERVNAKSLIKPTSDVDILNTYIRQMEHYIAFRELVGDWNLLFKDEQVRQAIRDTYGKPYMDLIDKLILNISRNGSREKGLNEYEKLAKEIRGNLARGMVGMKVMSVPKQLTSFLAFSEGMDMQEFGGEIFNFLKNPKKHIDEMKLMSEFVLNRWDNSDRDVAMLTNTSEYKGILRGVIPPSFNNMTMMFVKGGDIGAIYAGAWARYQINRRNGMSHEDAVRDFELLARNTQQSSELGSLSAAQQGNEFSRLFTMFSSAQRQYWQRVLLANEANKHGRMDNAERTKRLIMYGVALPALFQIVAQGGFSDEDDARSVLKAIAVSPLQAVPVGGQAWQYMMNRLILGHTFGRGAGNMAVFSPLERSMKGLNKLLKMEIDDITMSDVLEAVRDIAAISEYAGIPAGGMMGVPVGFQDIVEGEGLEGSLEILGMSPYTAEKRANK